MQKLLGGLHAQQATPPDLGAKPRNKQRKLYSTCSKFLYFVRTICIKTRQDGKIFNF